MHLIFFIAAIQCIHLTHFHFSIIVNVGLWLFPESRKGAVKNIYIEVILFDF